MWLLVSVPIYMLLALHVLMPMRWMSALMGGLAPLLAPWTKWHQRAKANLQLAMPELTATEQKAHPAGDVGQSWAQCWRISLYPHYG